MRCYFNLVNNYEVIPDELGVDVPDIAKAKGFALEVIEDVRAEAVDVAESWQGWRLDVVNPSGSVLLSIPLEPTLQ